MRRSVFSENWHSVANLRPRLLPHTRIYPHTYRGKRWYIVRDTTGGRSHRISPDAYRLVSRMDGVHSVQSLWDEACLAGDDEIPTQDELVQLLMQLHSNDLLHCDVTPDSAELFERYTKRKRLRWKQWITQPMSVRIPVLDPDAFLTRWVHRLSWLFTSKGAVLWLAVVVPAILLAEQHWRELTTNLSDQVLSKSNLLVLALVFPIVKAIHELGHGFASKVWGGAVHEMGIMFLVFAPVPYVDASSSSVFRSKYRRAVVGAAGMLAEVFVAALAMYVWVSVEPGVVRAVAFNVMLIAGVSTLIVNGNPLLRYDGYYILSDLIEIPNLSQRGQRYLSYLSDRFLFGAKEEFHYDATRSEKIWFFCYTIAAWFYRLFIAVSIILFVAGKFFIFGVVLAIIAAIGLIVRPIWKAGRHVLESPTLHRRRTRAVTSTIAVVSLILVIGLFVPVPLRTQTEGVVWLPEKAIVRAGENGIFQHWLIEPGAHVSKGDAILTMDNPQLAAELEVARARKDEARARYTAKQFDDPVEREVLRQQLNYEKDSFDQVNRRYEKLVVRAESNGVLTVPKAQDMTDRYFKKGDLLGYVMNKDELIARAAVYQDNINLVRTRLKGVELRFADDVADSYRVSLLRETPSALNELPTPALSPAGGGRIPVDPSDGQGLKTLDRVFFVDVSLPKVALPNAVGGRVYIRFDHVKEPFLEQMYRRIRQLFLSRFNV